MNRLLFLIITILSLTACKEKAVETSKPETTIDQVQISEKVVFKSYDVTHNLIQGSWSNTLDPASVIIIKEHTTSNMYRELIATENAPYSLNTSCLKAADSKTTEEYRYINTPGEFAECYYIKTLDQDTLVMDYLRGDITLTFKRLE